MTTYKIGYSLDSIIFWKNIVAVNEESAIAQLPTGATTLVIFETKESAE
jgi:hypothetical protein